MLMFCYYFWLSFEWNANKRVVRQKTRKRTFSNFFLLSHFLCGGSGAKQTKRHWIKEENTLTPTEKYLLWCLSFIVLYRPKLYNKLWSKLFSLSLNSLFLSLPLIEEVKWQRGNFSAFYNLSNWEWNGNLRSYYKIYCHSSNIFYY